MRKYLFFIRLIAFFLAAAACAEPDPNPKLGINLAGPSDWSTELPFVNVFHMSRPWISQQKGKDWGKGPLLDLDQQGWVKSLAPDCWAETLLCTINGGHYPSGKYTVLYTGRGKLTFNNAQVVSSEDSRIVIEPDPSKGAFFLRITETDPADYIRNIRVIMPGFERKYVESPWHPAFLHRWQGMAALRYMDFMLTNNSRIEVFSERPQPGDATFAEKGVALELLIDLVNRLKADPWFCIPHLANDDYVRQTAQMIREQLDPALKVYVEYSNEVWNGQFKQHHYAGQKGQELGFAEKEWEAAWAYTAYRSVQIFEIFEDVFGGTGRLVRVLPSQAANPYVAEQILQFQDAYKHADALAIAPYMACNVPRSGNDLNAEFVSRWRPDQALDYLHDVSMVNAIKHMRANKEVADKYGLKLIAYEGGQHMVEVGRGDENERITRLFHEVNRSTRMGDIYREYYAGWIAAGGDLFCHFSSVSNWTKYGSWGLMQYYDDDPKDYPKFTATMEWAESLGQNVILPE